MMINCIDVCGCRVTVVQPGSHCFGFALVWNTLQQDAAGEPIQLILSDTPEGIKQDLLGKLAELQARKGHMDVTADVLHDNHIKQLGWQRFG